jgi:hypothetical protein
LGWRCPKGRARNAIPTVMEADIVDRVSRALRWFVGLTVAFIALPALGQSNLDAGKSAAQMFSDACGACHRSPRELKPTSVGFLTEHYSTGGRAAAAMAAYLASIGSDPRAVRERRPPTLGAGQSPPPGEAAAEPAKPLLAARPRRPSESMEIGKLPVAFQPGTGQEAVASQTAEVPPFTPRPIEEFEE